MRHINNRIDGGLHARYCTAYRAATEYNTYRLSARLNNRKKGRMFALPRLNPQKNTAMMVALDAIRLIGNAIRIVVGRNLTPCAHPVTQDMYGTRSRIQRRLHRYSLFLKIK